MVLCLPLMGDDLPRAPGYPEPHPEALLKPEIIHSPGAEYGDVFRMYQGVPTIERSPEGRLWAAWHGGGRGEHPYNYVMLATSEDDGENWSDPTLVIDTAEGPVPEFDPATWPANDQIGKPTRVTDRRRVSEPTLWHDPDGRLWFFWAQERRRSQDAPYRPFVTWAMVSDDSGAADPQWSEPRPIAIGHLLNKPTVLSGGEWLFPLDYWNFEPSAGVVVSRDKGQTFEFFGGASIFPERRRNCDEHMIVERNDGSLWMLVRGYFNRIGESVSTDGGRTWSSIEITGRYNRLPVTDGQLGHPNARFFVRRLSSGNILLVKHGAIGEVTRPRARLMAFLSDDEGHSWKGGLMIDERVGVSYPDGVEGDDGVVRVVYDFERRGNMEGGKSVHMARFTEEDIFAGRPVSDVFATRLPVNQAKGVHVHQYNLNDNDDGDDMSEPTTKWGLAHLEPMEGDVATLENGVKLFGGRNETAFQIPQELLGRQFIRGYRGGVRFRAIEGGLVYAMSPAPERTLPTYVTDNRIVQPHSQVESLLKSGFRKTDFPEVLLFNGPENVVSTYYRHVEEGEEIELGEWAVVVF